VYQEEFNIESIEEARETFAQNCFPVRQTREKSERLYESKENNQENREISPNYGCFCMFRPLFLTVRLYYKALIGTA
jgi:hypothetical protein